MGPEQRERAGHGQVPREDHGRGTQSQVRIGNPCIVSTCPSVLHQTLFLQVGEVAAGCGQKLELVAVAVGISGQDEKREK